VEDFNQQKTIVIKEANRGKYANRFGSIGSNEVNVSSITDHSKDEKNKKLQRTESVFASKLMVSMEHKSPSIALRMKNFKLKM